jgi:hypothetical protein
VAKAAKAAKATNAAAKTAIAPWTSSPTGLVDFSVAECVETLLIFP